METGVHPQINLPSGAVVDTAGGTKNGAFSETHRIFVSRNGLGRGEGSRLT